MRTAYVLRRVAQIIPLVLGVVAVNFLIIHLTPGDPASALAGDMAPPQYVEQLRQQYGLDKPLVVQLLVYFKHLLTGDLGYSFSYQQSVGSLVLGRIPATALLILAAQIPAIVFGTLLGAFAARHHGSWADRLIGLGTLGLYAVPVFLSGMLFILVFALKLKWFPTSGMTSFDVGGSTGAVVLDTLRHLVLPALTLGLYLLPVYARITRASVLEVMHEHYITTARSIGFSENVVFFRHALRNALLPTITTAGISIGLTFGGALLTETVFAWPGMGQLMYNALFQRDYPLIMGIFFVTAISVAVVSVITDVLLALADPRVAYE
jgi:peptide/nickel transport system permease protein